MPFMNIKGAMIGLVAMLAVFGIMRVVTAVTDFMEHVQLLEESNTTLTAKVSSHAQALKISEASNAALLTENQRIKGIEAAHQQRESQLNQQLNQEKKESRNEISRLESALRKAGVTDVSVPDDVIRMQRERAKAVNQRAASYSRQQPPAGTGR
ncbi:hypothetical protein ACSI5N_25430 (plasmid) [Raoultella ornithinolytica]|uniref:hypothetical protein n=1 Tax=Raoultella ornithinolytica TaxID=54291 RepID=UPI00292B66CA|nr:hypothetical protein [Raoultella ornithinolytica]MDV1094968.1 hypothetical protein [Raoultella ornithinolytica]MDV1122688.1 hypothetical protein [Raoultella ornithinolytica]MDV1893203.1 hypothetical protein [Raoultella ornithinolytica]